MGNSLALHTAFRNSRTSRYAPSDEHKKVVQIVKTDGKILKFTAAILVQDLLLKFPGLSVAEWSESGPSESLPLSYELKLGNVYDLFPSLVTSPVKQPSTTANSGVITKTIKVVITKKQLQDLVSKKISLGSVVSSEIITQRESCTMDSGPRGWKPRLESIPEGNEFVLSLTNY